MITLAQLLYPTEGGSRHHIVPAEGPDAPNLHPIIEALSGTPTNNLELHEPVYVAAHLQKYWLDVYCHPEEFGDDGPPFDDELHQAAFADWVELFGGRYWRQFGYCQMQIVGYYCSEVENTVPDDWLSREAGWNEVARAADWWLESIEAKNGRMYRLCMYAEGGFDLQFWFYCERDDDAEYGDSVFEPD